MNPIYTTNGELITSGADTGLIAGGLILLIFAYFYNRVVDRAYKNNLENHVLGYLVIGGVAVIGIVFGLLRGWNLVFDLAALSTAAGLPMIIGEQQRQAARIKREKEDIEQKLNAHTL